MLKGERVLLRGIERDDLPALWEIHNDLEVVHRANSGRPEPTSLARLQARFDARATEPETQAVRFVVELDGVVVGQCSLHLLDPYSQISDLGIMLHRDRWGQGHGTDAVRTLLAYAWGPVNLRKVSLEVLADEARAVGAYRRAGFVEEGRFRDHSWYAGGYRDVLRMAVFRPRPPA